MAGTSKQSFNLMTPIARRFVGRNSLLFIMVIVIFSLLLYSSVMYVIAINRVMEEQGMNFAMYGLVSDVNSVYQSAKTGFESGLSDDEILKMMWSKERTDVDPLVIHPFIISSNGFKSSGENLLPPDLPDRINENIIDGSTSSHLIPINGSSVEVSLFEIDGSIWLTAISPHVESGRLFGFTRDITPFLNQAKKTQRALIGSLALASVLFFSLLILVFRVLTYPLRNLTKAAEQIASGDLTARVKVPSGIAELAILAETFNKMGAELERQHDSLEAYSQKLIDANWKAGQAVEELSRRHREQKAMIDAYLEANKLDYPEDVMHVILRRLMNDLLPGSLNLFRRTVDGQFISQNFTDSILSESEPADGEVLGLIRSCDETRKLKRLPVSINGEGTSHFQNDASERIYLSLAVGLNESAVIELVAAEAHSFNRENEEFCKQFISYMEIILRNKTLYRETVRRSQELGRINLISRSISGKLDFDSVIRDVVEYSEKTLDAECAFIGLINNGRIEIRHMTPGTASLDQWVIDLKADTLLSELVECGQPLLINRLDSDERVKPDVFMKQNEFKSFIGSPIIRKDEVLGVICGFSRINDAFTDNDSYFLGLLASQVAIALDNARMFEEILARDRRRNHQLHMAQKLQEDRIPRYFKQNVAAVSCRLQPADELAGDFCDVFSLGRNSIAVVIGDVANKGVAASLMTFSLLSMFRNVAKTLKSPCGILDSINRTLIPQIKEDGWFATSFYCKLNTKTGILTFSSAGHEQPIWYHADTDEVELLEASGYPLGLFKSFPYETQEIKIKEGDRIVLYTDGVTDAADADGNRFCHSTLLDIVSKSGYLSGDELIQKILDEVEGFTGGIKQKDDMIVAVLELQDDPWIHKRVSFAESGDLIMEILETLAPYELDHQATYSIRLAIDEAFANAWKHGLYESYGGKFDVSYIIDDEGFRLRVKDPGTGFDHESLPDPTVEENLFKSNGRGVFLIRQMMDDVEFNESGNELTVFKEFAPLNGPYQESYDGLLLDSLIEMDKQQDSLRQAMASGSSTSEPDWENGPDWEDGPEVSKIINPSKEPDKP